jgi:hypothetical protein
MSTTTLKVQPLEAWMVEGEWSRGFLRRSRPAHDEELTLYGADWTNQRGYEDATPAVRVMVVEAATFEAMQAELARLRRATTPEGGSDDAAP